MEEGGKILTALPLNQSSIICVCVLKCWGEGRRNLGREGKWVVIVFNEDAVRELWDKARDLRSDRRLLCIYSRVRQVVSELWLQHWDPSPKSLGSPWDVAPHFANYWDEERMANKGVVSICYKSRGNIKVNYINCWRH